MRILLNGKEKEISQSSSILQLLEELQLHPQQVAVEVNRTILKRDQFEQCTVQDGDEIEVLRFVGGGSADRA